MKKKFVIVLSSLLVLSLSACQATPTQSIVKEKNLDKMIQEATQTQSPAAGGTSTTGGSATTDGTGATATSGAPGQSLANKMGAQKTYVKELVDAKGKVKIHVNADVQIPDTTGVSVQRVGQSTITEAQVDVLVQRLMKGNLFSGNDYKPSKKDIQNQILQIEAAISKGAPSNNPKIGKSYFQDELKNLQQELITAPDETTKTPIDGKLTTMNPDDGGGQSLYALSQPADDVHDSLHVYDYSDGTTFAEFSSEKNDFSRVETFVTKDLVDNGSEKHLVTEQDIANMPDLKVSKDDAKKMADDFVNALGEQSLVCIFEDKEYGGSGDMTPDQSAYINPRKCVWYLRYARSVNGVTVTHTDYDCGKVEVDNQAQPWGYEDMTFAIDDTGIVAFTWRSPYKMEDVVTQNSNILSFGNAINIFNTMCPVVNAWDGFSEDDPKLKSVDIRIDHIQFGLTRITEQNKRNSGLLVPCWDFFGTMTYNSAVNGKDQTIEFGPVPILTINAIDGSIINRSLGY